MSCIDVEKKTASACAVPLPEEMIEQQKQLLDSQVEVFVRHCLAELRTQQPRGKIIGEVRFYNNQPHVVAKALEIFTRLGWRVVLRKRLFWGNSRLIFSSGELRNR